MVSEQSSNNARVNWFNALNFCAYTYVMSMGVSETVYAHVCIYNYVCAMMCVYNKQVYINTSVRVFTPLQLAGIDQDFSLLFFRPPCFVCRVRDHIGNLWAS